MFPQSIINMLAAGHPLGTPAAQSEPTEPVPKRPAPFPAWSAIDSAKSKADAIAHEADREFNLASKKVQERTGKIEPGSLKYYASCTFGGILACGLTHTAVTPLDLIKCRRQVDPKLYQSNIQAYRTIRAAEGFRGIFTGWSPTFFGYSAQGAFKYGGYEFFKSFYSDLVGQENAHKWKTSLYLTASASAEVIADVALCPFESIKVRTQTTIPPDIRGTFSGISGVVAKEGVAGLYKGLYPLWGRQVPYTMMKFASFETIVEMIYRQLPGHKSDYNKGAQTAVAFTGGYLAGILCAVVSHPADVMVSKLNANRQFGEAFGAAMSRIYGDIGFRGLWNGLPVRIVMIGTLTGLQWMIYDSFKIFMGLPTTGGSGEDKKKGQGNIGHDDTEYVDGEIVREGVYGDQGDGAYSAGRGGAGNIGSPMVRPTSKVPHDAEMIPELAVRGSTDENYHVGRGGQGNIHLDEASLKEKKDKEREKSLSHEGLADKLKNKLLGRK
ncbi:hypothetical protein PENARI_c006G12344 [Penicillium arizonense]|uniref:Mitochondrial thiamine pyrophosphate carrier 1 n=1 Tax=Penicillium arizonense TaxID=1835702 RepID=A0A1F5LMZ3_PENAI|nr:hypothetical protein PENARI_c006G12344 [Penicillium arizonense]OGE54299.1 hypothetical protein PENARI_c006G12344 [Penicillium arizonense]